MDKDSYEYRLWLASIIGLALIFIIMLACAAIFAPKEFATRQTFPILIIGLMIFLDYGSGRFVFPLSSLV